MQHSNIDLVQRVYGAYMGGDRETVIAALDASIRWHNSGYDATSGTLEGPDAVLDYLMGENHLEDYDLTVVDMLASDTRVAVIAGRPAASATPGSSTTSFNWSGSPTAGSPRSTTTTGTSGLSLRPSRRPPPSRSDRVSTPRKRISTPSLTNTPTKRD